MKFSHTLIAVAILALSPSAFASDTLATVNGKVIKQSLYDFIAKDATARGQKIDAQVKEVIINKLIDSELVYQKNTRFWWFLLTEITSGFLPISGWE